MLNGRHPLVDRLGLVNSIVRLGAMLTDAPLVADQPYERNDCAACQMCQEACPAQAVSGEEVSLGNRLGYRIDRDACEHYLRRYEHLTHRRKFCGLCLKAYPHGKTSRWDATANPLGNSLPESPSQHRDYCGRGGTAHPVLTPPRRRHRHSGVGRQLPGDLRQVWPRPTQSREQAGRAVRGADYGRGAAVFAPSAVLSPSPARLTATCTYVVPSSRTVAALAKSVWNPKP